MPKKKKSNLKLHHTTIKKYLTIRGRKYSKDTVLKGLEKILNSLKGFGTRHNRKQAAAHYKRISASNAYRVFSDNKSKSVHSKLDWSSIGTHEAYIGKIFEQSVKTALGMKFSNFLCEETFYTHQEYPWLGCTPDGILKIVKCQNCSTFLSKLSKVIRHFRSEENNKAKDEENHRILISVLKNLCYEEKVVVEFKAVGRYLYARNFDDAGCLIEGSEIYFQNQYTMFVKNAKKTLLIVYNKTNKYVYSHVVDFSEDFISKTLPKIQDFYKGTRLAYIFHKSKSIWKRRRIKKSSGARSGIEKQKLEAKGPKRRRKFFVAPLEDQKILVDWIDKNFCKIFFDGNLKQNNSSFNFYQNMCHESLKSSTDELLKNFDVMGSDFSDSPMCVGTVEDLRAFRFSEVRLQCVLYMYFKKRLNWKTADEKVRKDRNLAEDN